MSAALLLLARLFRLGFLADFLSRTVLVGFLTGVGIQVAVAMLGDMVGVPFTSRETLAQAWDLAQDAARIELTLWPCPRWWCVAFSSLAGACPAGR